MTVSIDIDLDALDAQMEIANLRVMLESLGDDLDLDLDLDGELGSQLDDLTKKMDKLSDSFEADLSETIDRLESLEFDDISVDRGRGNSGGDTGSDSGDYVPSARQYFSGGVFEDDTDSPSGIRQAVEKFHRNVDGINDAFEVGDRFASDGDDDGGSSPFGSIRAKIQDAARASGVVDSEVGDLDARMPMTEDEGRTLQKKIDDVFGDDFDFQVDPDLSNRMGGGVYGSTDMGTMSLDNYRQVKDVDGVEIPFPDRDEKKGGLMNGFLRRLDSLGDAAGGLKTSFRKLVPTMQMWWSLIAAAIPALGAMAVQALGVASAMGAMAVSGAGIIGLGLIGHGDSMAESFRNAGEQVDELKQNLFDTFEPTADLFAPAQAEFFDFIPGQMDRIATSMEGLLVFKSDLFELFRGGTQFVSDLIEVMTDHSGVISGLTAEFSALLGENILSFFEWLLETTAQNKDMLIKLGSIFKTVAIAIYEVFMMVSRAIVMLQPFFGILSFVAELLNNSFVSGLVAVVSVIYLMLSALSSVAVLLGTGLIPLFSSMFSTMSAYIFQTLTATMANYGLAASIANVAAALGTLMAMTGVGLLIAGGGLALGKATGLLDAVPSGGSRGGSMGEYQPYGSDGGTTNIVNEGDTVNVDIGDADTSTIEKFSDMGSGGGDRGPTGGSYTGS